ncbi:hypothetical protein MLD38_026139 [Melastoma candidum]|uniref:Uncharacterized protein n=1 Tax=Melastoma candidum TaxID=119954 RepID=A0ACB9NXN1_9MYRT|nr:hypothetical protein MLD38_026139 [Melastoma candidum]
MNSLIFLSELPPFLTALFARSLSFAAFLLKSLLHSPFTTRFMHASTSCLPIKSCSPFRALTPTFHTTSRNLALVGWSLHDGIPIIGTPMLRALRVEFHPRV